MQNGSNPRKKPSRDEFTSLIETMRRRIPRDRFNSGADYILALFRTGLALNNPNGKDVIIMLLAAAAATCSTNFDDSAIWWGAVKQEVAARAIYDSDYQTMLKFIEMVEMRSNLTQMSKAEGLKQDMAEMLKSYFREEDDAAAPASGQKQ